MSGYYPAGLTDNTPGCPWSEPIVPEEEFEITCSQSLSRTVTVTTNNYIPGASGVDCEPDGEGGVYTSHWNDDPDTSDTNWAEEYHDNDYHTPLQLIQLLGKILEEDLKNGIHHRSPKYTESLIAECKGWIEDETEYIKN